MRDGSAQAYNLTLFVQLFSTISIEGTSSYTTTFKLTPNCQPIPVRVSYRHGKKMAKCIKRSNIIIPCLPMNCISQPSMIDACLLNARSIRNKTLIIKDFVIDNDIDILTLTKTWLNPNSNDQTIINSICPTGYLFQQVPREKRGGGVGILYKQSLKLKAGLIKSATYQSFEVADYIMNYSTFATRMLVIYRSPLSADGTTINFFLSEFSNLLQQIITDSKPIIILGDFNLHVDLPNNVAALKFLDLLETFGL